MFLTEYRWMCCKCFSCHLLQRMLLLSLPYIFLSNKTVICCKGTIDIGSRNVCISDWKCQMDPKKLPLSSMI